jgi:hypothetical protein
MSRPLGALRRAATEFRLAPRGFLAQLRHPPRLTPDDREEAERLARFYGPVANPSGGSGHALLLSYLPLPYTMKVEALLARALQARGWRISVVASEGSAPLARAFHARLLGCEVLRLEDFVDFSQPAGLRTRIDEALNLAREDLTRFKGYMHRSAPVALHALASLSAARPEGGVGNDTESLRLLGRLLRRSLLLQEAAGRLYDRLRPTLALGVEKGFVGTCETFYAALERGVDYVQWVGCHEPESLMFKRYRPDNYRDHPFSISDANWARLRALPWRDSYRETVLAEFERGYKDGAWFRYKGLGEGRTFADRAELLRRLALDPAKKTAIIYSHILNDANLFYGNDLFPGGYEQWLVETVRAAADTPAVNWVLKIHPANVYRNAKMGYQGEYGELLALKRAFGRVPEFLRIVRPEERVSPLSFFALTDWGVTVRGTVGLELPCMGVPVLTAGTGRYSGKGFTVDSGSIGEYLERIRRIDQIPALDEAQTRLGVLYAYHVFRSRPARYGAVMQDVYRKPLQDARYRDVEIRLQSLDEAIAHPQLQAMVAYLTSNEEDFLDA